MALGVVVVGAARPGVAGARARPVDEVALRVPHLRPAGVVGRPVPALAKLLARGDVVLLGVVLGRELPGGLPVGLVVVVLRIFGVVVVRLAVRVVAVGTARGADVAALAVPAEVALRRGLDLGVLSRGLAHPGVVLTVPCGVDGGLGRLMVLGALAEVGSLRGALTLRLLPAHGLLAHGCSSLDGRRRCRA